jgi:hypothetical protein
MKRNIRDVAALVALFVIGSAVAGFTFSGSAPTAATDSARQPEIQPAQMSEINGYRAWTKVNPQPVLISSVLVAELCRPATTDNNMHNVERSPHVDKQIMVYVNETGQHAMMAELKPKFPVGSVIVKEKLSGLKGPKGDEAPELLTVMVKRERGFNPQVGDWEFIATNGAGTKVDARGRLESCRACHVSMKDTDFISRVYLPDELRSKLR